MIGSMRLYLGVVMEARYYIQELRLFELYLLHVAGQISFGRVL